MVQLKVQMCQRVGLQDKRSILGARCMNDNGEPTIEQLVNSVSEELNAQVHLYSGAIDDDGFGKLLTTLQPTTEQPYRNNILLILTTGGGLANAAYRIARTLQSSFDKFHLYVPAYCKSAGTLISLGAHRLIMEEVAELGPLDVQLIQRDEIGQRKSGMVIRTAFNGLAEETLDTFERIMMGIKAGSQGSVSFETASRIASTMSSSVMAPVYAQINPEDLGNDLRDLNVATQYGRRLIVEAKNCNENTVRSLVSDYPSHDFIIDRQEAKSLFKVVDEPSHELKLLTNALGSLAYREFEPKAVLRLDKLETANDDHNTTEETAEDGGARDEEAGSASSDMDAGRKKSRRSSPKRSSEKDE